MMRFLKRVFLHNLALKLLALLISFSLWSLYTAEPMAQYGYEVPVAFVNVPRNLAIGNDAPTAVHLLIQGHAALMRRLAPSDLALTVDLSHAAAGETQVHLSPQMAALPYGTSVLRIAPQDLRVSLLVTPTPSAPAAH
jgi:hypothetical protein